MQVKIINMIGHILMVGVTSLAVALGRDINFFSTLYSMAIGYIVGVGVEVGQFAHHYQNIRYNNRYRAMIYDKFGSKPVNESWLAYSWRTYDRDKTKFDLIRVNGLLGGTCSIILIYIFAYHAK